MKAIRIHQFGPTEEVLQYEEVPTPEPGPGALLIKVEAASLNRADLGLRKGTYRVSPDQLPQPAGFLFAPSGGDDFRAKMLGDLDRGVTDAAATPLYQQPFAPLEIAVGRQAEPGGEKHRRQCCGLR